MEKLEEMMDQYIHLRQKARDVFEMRYQETINPDENRWELCSRVLARRDVEQRLSEPWQSRSTHGVLSVKDSAELYLLEKRA